MIRAGISFVVRAGDRGVIASLIHLEYKQWIAVVPPGRVELGMPEAKVDVTLEATASALPRGFEEREWNAPPRGEQTFDLG